jgi:hypothetical protein
MSINSNNDNENEGIKEIKIKDFMKLRENENMSKEDMVKEIMSMQKQNPKIHINGYCDFCHREIGVSGICMIGCKGYFDRNKQHSQLYDCILCDELNDNEDKLTLRKHMITSHYYGDLVDWVIESIIESEDYPEIE